MPEQQPVTNGGEAPPAAGQGPIPTPAPPVGEGGGGDSGQPDPNLPDHSDTILEAFGLEGDWGAAMSAAEARLAGPGAREGQASATPSGASAAEGGSEASATPAPPASPPQQPAGVSQEPQSAPGATPAAAAPAPAAPASSGTTPEPTVQALKAQVDALQALLARQQPSGTGAAPTTQPSPPAPASAPGMPTPEELQDYSQVGIPADVLAAIDSEDANQRAAGIRHLVTSMAKLTHARVMQHVDQVVQSRLADAQAQQQVTTQQQEMMRDYYSAHPLHDSPANRIVVAMEAQAMWQENPALAWSQATRDALGARVNAKLGLGSQPTQVQPSPSNGAAAPQKPAAMTGASTRPQKSRQEEAGQEMVNILSAL